MPQIVIYMYDDLFDSRSEQDKDSLVSTINDAMERYGGATPGSTQVIIHGTPRDRWAMNGRRGTAPQSPTQTP